MDERSYTKAGILAGAERWGQVIRDFLDSGEELEPLDPADFGAHGEDDVQGLADALAFSALAVGLDKEVLVDIFEGKVMLVRTDAIERHPADAGPADDYGIDYGRVVALVLHRGFRRTGLDFEPGEVEPEVVLRGLERAIAAAGEVGRLTVKVESPTCVAVRMEGGHIEPLTLPRSLGLTAWERRVDKFIFSDDLSQQQLVKPGKVDLDEALEKTITTVKAMELDDFLVVDTFKGSVRLRHGRDVGAEELEEWSARVAAMGSLPFEQDGSIYYDGLLERVLHRGFNTLTFDLEANEDPEAVKRGLELAAAKRGERDRITVKVAGPEQVSVRLKGGHRLPRVVPRKLGLARWVDAMESFIFEDELLDEHLISPGGASLEEALKQTIAAVKAMELEDFLTVDLVGGRVRVRRTRDVGAGDEHDIATQCRGLLDGFQRMPDSPGVSVEFTECDADVHEIIEGLDAEIAFRGLQNELHTENRMGIPYLIRGPKPQGVDAPLMRFDEEGTPLLDADRIAQALGMGPEIECAKMLRFFIDDGGDSLCVNLSKFGMEESNLHTMLVKVIDEHFGGQVRATLDAAGGSGIWLWKPGIDPDPRWARSIVESMVAATESGEGTSADIDLADVDPRTAEEAARFLREELVRRNLDDSYTVAVAGERTVSIEST